MKYLITMVLMVHGGLTLAEQFGSWEEHTLAAMEAKIEQENRGLIIAPTIVTVGTDGACDFRVGNTRIQDAIDTAPDIIRIVTDTYNEDLAIDDISIDIVGGYANCTDADNNVSDGNRVTVAGLGGNTAVLITGDTQRNTINIENITFQDGAGFGFVPGGAITTVGADLQLNLTNVWLANNTGSLGGGMSIVGGNTDILGIDFLVFNNTAEQGGGIYCSSADASILMTGASGITANNATNGDGGGALLQNGCILSTYSGTDGGFLDLRGIAGNSATENGGGIAVESGSTANLIGNQICFFVCFGDNDEPLNVSGNTADSDDDNSGRGGGIYVTGANSNVTAFTTLIRANDAYRGGGVSVDDQATFETRYVVKNCWNSDKCNQIVENTSDLHGGALYAATAGEMTVAQTYFEENRSDLGVVGYSRDTDSLIDVEGSVITNNGNDGADGYLDDYIFRTFMDGELLANFVTIADNNLTSATFGNNDSSMIVWYSIIHDPGTVVYDPIGASPTFSTFCNVVNEDATIPGGVQIFVDDPEFVDRVGGDYHIDANLSPAADLCQVGFFPPDFQDIDLEDFGFDDATITNVNGPFDAGADETYTNDIIFIDSFD